MARCTCSSRRTWPRADCTSRTSATSSTTTCRRTPRSSHIASGGPAHGGLADLAGVPTASVAAGPVHRREPIPLVHLDEKVPRCDEVEPDADQQLPFLRRPCRELDPVEQAGIGPTKARRILYSPISRNRYAVPKGVAAVDVASATQARGPRSVQ